MPTRQKMSLRSRREYLTIKQVDYRKASRKERSAMLDEMVQVTQLNRKDITQLMKSDLARKPRRRQRGRTCGKDVEEAVLFVAECLDFITSVPTVWDETRALTAQVGDWVAVARRRGNTWYVGAMTDWTPRELDIDLSFLGDGDWQAVIFEDGVNADRNANDYTRREQTIRAGESLRVALAPGGGWAARLERRP